MKRERTYRLAPKWRPLPGERTHGNGHRPAPYVERMDARRKSILKTPPGAAGGAERETRGRVSQAKMTSYAVLLCITANEPPSHGDCRFDELKRVSGLPAAQLQKHLEFWVEHGVVVQTGGAGKPR